MALKEMTTLTLEGSDEVYEIVDELARQEIAKLKADSGGTKIFNVNFTSNEELLTVTSNKSVDEIITAYTNGQSIIGLIAVDNHTLIAPMTAVNETSVVFSFIFGEGSINIAGVDGSAVDTSSDVWDIVMINLASDEDVDKKIAEAIGTVENGSY